MIYINLIYYQIIKIKKGTRNIFVYKLLDKNNIIDDYDDDGEHYAGIRILGLLQKMKIYHILILFLDLMDIYI